MLYLNIMKNPENVQDKIAFTPVLPGNPDDTGKAMSGGATYRNVWKYNDFLTGFSQDTGLGFTLNRWFSSTRVKFQIDVSRQ